MPRSLNYVWKKWRIGIFLIQQNLSFHAFIYKFTFIFAIIPSGILWWVSQIPYCFVTDKYVFLSFISPWTRLKFNIDMAFFTALHFFHSFQNRHQKKLSQRIAIIKTKNKKLLPRITLSNPLCLDGKIFTPCPLILVYCVNTLMAPQELSHQVFYFILILVFNNIMNHEFCFYD